MVHGMSGALPLYIVNEYPKSGGTWVGNMLAAALELPFPRNCMPGLRSCVMHGHYYRRWGMKNVLVLWRDGRDVTVSWYHHCLFRNELHNAPLVEQVRRDLDFDDYEDVAANLPRFIEYSFTRQRHPPFSWADFVRQWHGAPSAVYTKYEDLRQDTASELVRLAHELADKELAGEDAAAIAERFSFEQMAGRNAGEEERHSFLRKGVVGDWQNHFSREARQLFDQLAGDELIALGYETDRSWIDAEPPPNQ